MQKNFHSFTGSYILKLSKKIFIPYLRFALAAHLKDFHAGNSIAILFKSERLSITLSSDSLGGFLLV